MKSVFLCVVVATFLAMFSSRSARADPPLHAVTVSFPLGLEYESGSTGSAWTGSTAVRQETLMVNGAVASVLALQGGFWRYFSGVPLDGFNAGMRYTVGTPLSYGGSGNYALSLVGMAGYQKVFSSGIVIGARVGGGIDVLWATEEGQTLTGPSVAFQSNLGFAW